MADDDVATPVLDAADLALVADLGVRRQVAVGEGSASVRSVHQYLAS